MATPRFYCPTELVDGALLKLPEAIAHHATRVLRLKAGTGIVLFNGQGGEHPAELVFDGKQACAHVGPHLAVEAELDGRITLAQGIASGDKMDWIIEKAVELGAQRLAPIAAQRSVLQLAGDRLEKRRRHWDRIVQSASEQCGRNRLMPVDAPCGLDRFLAQGDDQARILFCHPDASLDLAQALNPDVAAITILVGPEGGWSDDELALAQSRNVTPIRFGRSVLRTETAGLALIAAVSALMRWR